MVVNLIACYGNAGNLPETQKLFEEMAGLGDTPGIAGIRDVVGFHSETVDELRAAFEMEQALANAYPLS